LAQLAQQHSVKLALAIGGRDGSAGFSQLAANEAAVQVFVAAAKSILTTYGFEGISVDWECPGEATLDPANDTPSFLNLLRALRTAVGPTKSISAAVAEHLFFVNGAPTSDLSAFAAVLDWISPNVYDNFGPWVQVTALDAPMSVFTSTAALWHSAGFAKPNIVLGYPLYARAADVAIGTKGLNLPIIKFLVEDGDNKFTYDELMALFKSDIGWSRNWDAAELSAWWGKPNTGHFVHAPDPEAAQARAEWVVQNGYGGVFLFE
ncbi:glycoside hydrolase superfamily, partial [Blyttiomyces helicus]